MGLLIESSTKFRYDNSMKTSPFAISKEEILKRATKKFLANFDLGAPDECWNWKGPRQGNRDYGRLAYGKYTGPNFFVMTAHRFSYEHFSGEKIPPGMCACHRCDNPACVNPNHLFLGTQTENQADKKAKGRISRGEKHSLTVKPKAPRGSDNHASVLSEADIPKILEMRKRGNTHKEIAEHFGVAKSTIVAIFCGINWGYITGIKQKNRSEIRPVAKLNDDLVRQIFRMRDAGMTLKEIGKEIGVNKTCVHKVCQGLTWKHVKREIEHGII